MVTMVTVTSDKMHLSNMPCSELLKMMKESLHRRVERISGCIRQLEFIQLLFSEELFAVAVKMNKIEMSVPLCYIQDCMLYLLPCVSVKGCHSYVRFLCSVAYELQSVFR